MSPSTGPPGPGGPSTGPPGTATGNPARTWPDRVDATDWDAVRAGLDGYGCGLTGPLLSSEEAAAIAALYPDSTRFRSTVNMARHRFGEGEYRYFARPYPEAVTALKQALYPRLLPIARDWWARLGRPVRRLSPDPDLRPSRLPPGPAGPAPRWLSGSPRVLR